MKITDVFKEFINYSVLERCLEPTTTYWYENSIKSFYKYLRYKVLPPTVDVLTTENLRDYFVSHRLRGISPRSILNQMQSLKSFCTFLVKRSYLTKNPFDNIERPKLKRRLPDFLNEDEARELLRACISIKREYKSRWYRDIAIVALFLFTGIRRGELLNLKMGDLRLDEGYIKVSAKNKERMVPLNETVKAYIADNLKVRPIRTVDNVFVSTNRKTNALTEQGLGDVFRDLRSEVPFKKKFSPQILRHTFCTLDPTPKN